MAIGAKYLTSIRQYMRIASKDFDSELSNLINAARADMVLGGILAERANDETDPLVLQAIGTYVKAEFGLDNADAEKYRASYNNLKHRLMLANKYILPEG